MNKTAITQSKELLSDIFGQRQVNIALTLGGSLLTLYLIGVSCKILTQTAVNYKALKNVLQP
jgi:hypothetical protein